MENECEALPGVAYPGVRDNRSTLNTKTGYDDDDDEFWTANVHVLFHAEFSAMDSSSSSSFISGFGI